MEFSELPLNEIDGLVFSTLAYADFSGIISIGSMYEHRHTLKDAVRIYFKKRKTRVEKLNKTFVADIRTMLVKCAQSARYKDMKLISFVSVTDTVKKEQFGGLALEYMPDRACVAYRGTDNTIIGWREDFAMSYIHSPSQLEAVDFLMHTMEIWDGRLIITGHSKGGNLAMFASLMVEGAMDRVDDIYNYDGPGLAMKLYKDVRFEAVKAKLHFLVPQASMVGMIFDRNYTGAIVKSDQTGMKQHNPISWQVKGTRFCYYDKVTTSSKVFEYTMNNWINGLDAENKREFTETVFGMMEENGFDTFDDVSEKKRLFIFRCLSSMRRMGHAKRKMIGATAMNFVKSGIKGIHRQTIFARKKI